MKKIKCLIKTLTTITGLLLITLSLDVIAEGKGYEQARWNEYISNQKLIRQLISNVFLAIKK